MSATSFQRRRRELAEGEAGTAKPKAPAVKKTRAKTKAKPKALAKKVALSGDELSDEQLRDVIKDKMGEKPGDEMGRDELIQMYNDLSAE